MINTNKLENKTKQYTNLKVKDLGVSEVEIVASINAEVLDEAYKKSLKKLCENTKIDGFRKGHVPESVIVRELGEAYILERSAQDLLSNIYPAIVIDEKILAIGQPKIQITKLALGNALEFSAKTAIMPKVELPDYKKIAKKEFSKKADLDVIDKDMEDALKHIRHQRAQIESFEKQKKDGVEQPDLVKVDDKNLPELTDDFVKTLGDFKNVEEFKAKVRENLGEEKKLKDCDKKRMATVEEIMKQTKLELPTILVSSELQRIQAQFEGEIAQTGTKLEDYLKKIGKTIEELRKEWEPEAEKRGKLQLILNKIAVDNDIKPEKEDIEKEVSRVLERYKDADPENVRVYVETTKTNELVFKYLEEFGS